MATNTNLKDLEDVIRNATLLAGTYVQVHAFDYGTLEWKEKDDPVTACDKEAERILRTEIGKGYHVHFVGEEFGADESKSEFTVYMDPIDGTKSFSRGEFLSSVCVAAAYQGELFAGYVYDFMRGILYSANSEGAFVEFQGTVQSLPLKRLGLSKRTFAVGGGEKFYHFLHEYSQHSSILKGANLRKQVGSVGLAMAQLAAGAYDCLMMPPHRKNGETDVCDLAAGYFILKKAGFKVESFADDTFQYQKPEDGLVAYHPGMAEVEVEMVNKLKKFYRPVEDGLSISWG